MVGSLVIDQGFRGAAILVLAWLAAAVLRHRAAGAARHAVWTVALAGILALPALAAILPPLELALLMPRPPSVGAGAPTDGPPALALIWGVGAALAALRFAAAHLAAERTRGRATRLDDAGALAAFEVARRRTRTETPVELLVDAHATSPAAFGVVRPAIILPAEAIRWPRGQLTAVLVHELAHLRRGDLLAQVLAEIVCTLHWFDPLAWYAAGRLRIEREVACDQSVVAAGARPSRYAAFLLERICRGRAPAAARPAVFGRRSAIEIRLRALLEPPAGTTASQRPLAALLLVLPLIAVLRPSASPPPVERTDSVVRTVLPEPTAEEPEPAPSATATPGEEATRPATRAAVVVLPLRMGAGRRPGLLTLDLHGFTRDIESLTAALGAGEIDPDGLVDGAAQALLGRLGTRQP